MIGFLSSFIITLRPEPAVMPATFLAGADPGYYLMVDGYKGYNKVPGGTSVVVAGLTYDAIGCGQLPKGHEKDYTHPAVQGIPIL